MYIAIDGNEANVKQRVGANQHAYQVLLGLYKINKNKKNPDRYDIFLKKTPLKDFPPQNNNWNYIILGERPLWLLFKLTPYMFLNNKYDVFYTFSHYLPWIFGISMVCTIHDLGYLRFSGQFKKRDFWQLKYWSAISINISKYIIAVSEYTKKDIVRHYPFALKKVHVVYHGYEKDKYNNAINDNLVRQVKRKYKTGDNYLCFIGTLKPSKNIEGLLEAFKIVNEKYPYYRLVIGGKKGWMYKQIFEKVKNLKLENKVIFTDYLSEVDKPALIKGAKVFVLTSYWEGFGMDIITSLACGVAVVASDVASIPEVCSGACLLVNPQKPEDIAEKIESVLKLDKKGYNKLIKKGLIRSRDFSWDKTARQVYEILKKAQKK